MIERHSIGSYYLLQYRWREGFSPLVIPDDNWTAEVRVCDDPDQLIALKAHMASRQTESGDKMEFRIIKRTEVWEDEVVA
jgi:hypothetical protein